MSSAFSTLLQSCRRDPPRIAVVLGSGFGDLSDGFVPEISVPYPAVPGLEAPSVPGHEGRLAVGTWVGRRVLVFAGRMHYYEGHPWRHVNESMAIAPQLGARTVLLTNAAGG